MSSTPKGFALTLGEVAELVVAELGKRGYYTKGKATNTHFQWHASNDIHRGVESAVFVTGTVTVKPIDGDPE